MGLFHCRLPLFDDTHTIFHFGYSNVSTARCILTNVDLWLLNGQRPFAASVIALQKDATIGDEFNRTKNIRFFGADKASGRSVSFPAERLLRNLYLYRLVLS